jgi:hypothetical protein
MPVWRSRRRREPPAAPSVVDVNSTTNLKAGLAICALLAVIDVVGLAGTGMDDAPPFVVIAIGALFGLATLVALRPALRQVPVGLWTVIVTRVVSALSSLPPFFIDAPTWVRVACAVAIVLTVLGVGLLVPYVRRARGTAVRPA